MDVQKISYTVACTMVKVQVSLPEWLTRKDIQYQTGTSLQELRIGKVEVTDSNQSKIILHLLRNLSQSKGSGNVGGTFIEACSGITQVKSSGMEFHIGFRRRGVVHNGGMRTKGRNGLEAWTNKVAHLGTELIQLCCGRHLCNLNLADIFLKPLHKAKVCNAILNLGFTNILDLNRILDSLH